MDILEPVWQMWATFAVIGVAIALYASERLPLEQVSVGIVVCLLVLFQLWPLHRDGNAVLDARVILSGFADPALFAVVALLVVGQGLVRTGALDEPIRRATSSGRRSAGMLALLTIPVVPLLSAFVNNTPVVVVFIPVMGVLAQQLGRSTSQLMMPLSFAAILGGMTTLIGSSTNLLVSGSTSALGLPAIGLFDLAVPGGFLVLVGLGYILLVLPRILPDRASFAREMTGDGKQYIAQIEIRPDSVLVGNKPVAGMFPALKEMTVRLVQRGERAHLPPFDDLTLRPGDIVVVAATRAVLTEVLKRLPGHVGDDEAGRAIDPVVAEVMVAPFSRIIGRSMSQVGFHFHTGCIVLGVQRRSRMLRAGLDDIRLEAGDVLLVVGSRRQVEELRFSREVLLIERSAHDLPSLHRAWHARIIFAAVVVAAASGFVPIVTAALAGALAMVATGCLNLQQASRAVDSRIIVMVGAALAMGTALQATGGAAWLAGALIGVFSTYGPAVVLSVLFLLIAGLTNLISNNATAVLFTPIAVNAALALGVDPLPFIHAVVFAANCSFATPIGYQTNLLVMGPGHYRFGDYILGGLPLVILIWACFSLLAPWYYGF